MNRQVLLCRSILESPSSTQRDLAGQMGISLGSVNALIKECIQSGYISADTKGLYTIEKAGLAFLADYKVDGALFIAAGFGSRFVPLTYETPKGLLEVQGERMIERQIKQLREAGITDITIAVGYLKEKFEYLIDKYQVKLIYNPEYAVKNTLATIYHCRHVLNGRNMYILSSDNWMRENMFHLYEGGAWYSSRRFPGETSEWCLTYNKKGLITNVEVGGSDAWVMYGPVYFDKGFSAQFLPLLEEYYHLPGTEGFFWEQVYVEYLNKTAGKRLEGRNGAVPSLPLSLPLYINRQPAEQVYEFENLEELRNFDPKYRQNSDNQALNLIAKVFAVSEAQITRIQCLKTGMTNKSFLFEVKNQQYICRVPGPGTQMLINRQQEKAVYDIIAPLNITESLIYLDGETGYKISRYYPDARTANGKDREEMRACMAVLKQLHDAKLAVSHTFNLAERIDFYEKLCRETGGILFEDYQTTKEWAGYLQAAAAPAGRPVCLSHIDPNPDNFLILGSGEVKLIDWEYAAMADPLLDIAMCAIYCYYDFDEAIALLSLYQGREADPDERKILIALMGLSGLLWSLWAVYKSHLGEEFGEYTIIMYRYAKKAYRFLFP